MNLENIRHYCLGKEHATEGLPFNIHTLVFYVGGKIFALVPLDNPETSINLKCDPEWSMELRDEYPQITPGYHMNKVHWNTVSIQGLPEKLIRKLIDHSYESVIQSFTLKKKMELGLIKEIIKKQKKNLT